MKQKMPTRQYLRAVSLAAAAVLLTATGCAASVAPPSGGKCPDSPLVSTVFVDVTGSSYSGQIDDEDMNAISHVASRTAACTGFMSVATFGASSGQTVALIDQSFDVEAPTDNAVRRKQQKLADAAVRSVREKFADVAKRTPATSTDVVGLLRLAEEAKAQRPDAIHEVLVLTDGFTNVGLDPASAGTAEAATALANQVPVPDLSGVKLTLAGIGRTTSPVSSAVIEQVTVFWERVCERTQAASCTVVTKWQG